MPAVVCASGAAVTLSGPEGAMRNRIGHGGLLRTSAIRVEHHGVRSVCITGAGVRNRNSPALFLHEVVQPVIRVVVRRWPGIPPAVTTVLVQ